MRKIVIAVWITIGLCSCKQNKLNDLTDFKELKDSNLVLQVMKVKEAQDTTLIKYGIRIFPTKRILENMSEENKQALWYKMDSSFYLESGAKKFYAELTEPIANGQKDNFEYLLMFETTPEININDLSIVFNDKYFSHKIHSLSLNTKTHE